MSWLSENYDKAALGLAAAVALGVGYSVFSGGEAVPEPKEAEPNNTVALGQRGDLANAVKKYSEKYSFSSKPFNGNEVNSYASFPLYSIKGQSGIKPLTDDFEIHAGMPLKWWKKYDLSDYRLEDGPELDADGDGFTNREEFDVGTNPTDKATHPNFITKLKCTGATASEFEVNWTRLNEKLGNFSFKYNKRRLFYGTLGVGGKFPERVRGDKSLIGRFEILERAQDPNIPGENGEYFLLRDNGKELNNEFKVYYNQKSSFKDWTATFMLDIEGKNTEFKVPEGDVFSLPYDSESAKKAYKFRSKKDSLAEIEYDVDGKKSTVELAIPAK